MIVLLILFLVASLIFLIVVMAKRLNRQKVVSPLPLNTKKKQTISNLDSLEIINLKGKLSQLLESVELVSKSINVDIVISRFDFVEKLTADLSKYRTLDVYNRYFHEAVEEYKTMYFDKLISEEQVYFCNNLDDTDKLVEFYGVNLMRAYFMSVQNNMDAIAGMKQKRAMIGRYDKIIELSEMVKESIKSLSGLEKRNEYLQYILEVRQDASIKKDIL